MKTRSVFVLALAAGLSLPGLAQTPVCEVAALIGSAQRNGQSLKVGSGLSAGDEVQTAADSRMRLKCRDGSSLVMAAGSTLRIEAFEIKEGKRMEARFNLVLGLIGQKVSTGGGWNVRTPSAVTAVRGTEFTVEATEQSTAVLMQSGQVDVRPAGPQSRSLAGVLPLVALAGALGTDCKDGQCSVAAPWGAKRVKETLDKLSGV
jgi:hypothetical protein